MTATGIFDHISLGVSELDRAAAFYEAALAPLGLVRLWTASRAVGFGPPGYTGEAPLALVVPRDGRAAPSSAAHLALSAPDRAAVCAFHAAALAAGAVDDGPPGVREHYDPGYFAAFIIDFDGNRVEAVVHERGPAAAAAPGAPPEPAGPRSPSGMEQS